MDVIAILLSLVLIALIVTALLWIVAIAGALVWGLWPAVAGITAGVLLWRSGNDNWGVISILLGIGGNWLWFHFLGNRMDSSSHQSSDGPETAKDILRDIRRKLSER